MAEPRKAYRLDLPVSLRSSTPDAGRRPARRAASSQRSPFDIVDPVAEAAFIRRMAQARMPTLGEQSRQPPSPMGSYADRFRQVPKPAPNYSDGQRDYVSFEAYKKANPDAPLISNPPDPELEYQARRNRAFIDSIGAGALGLGPIAYVMGGAPDAIEASTQFDRTLGNLAAGAAMRPASARLTAQRPASAYQTNRWSSLANRLADYRGNLPVRRGEIEVQEIARASKSMNRELAYVRDRATNQRHLRDVGSQMGDVPSNSRLILHTHPGERFLSVKPSDQDRVALDALGQRSSVIVNEDGKWAIRYHRDARSDGRLLEYVLGEWRFEDE